MDIVNIRCTFALSKKKRTLRAAGDSIKTAGKGMDTYNGNNENAMRTHSSIFDNEKRLQKAFGLRYTPDRYMTVDAARESLYRYTRPHRVVSITGSEFTPGYYVVCPADAEKLYRMSGGKFIYV